MSSTTHRVLCLGEALVDVVNRNGDVSEHVGGSLLNVACGLARLNCPTALAAWWAHDARGTMITEHLDAHGVQIVPGSQGAQRTTVAQALLDDQGRATYEFDLLWDVPELPTSEQIRHLHIGSIAAILQPGANKVLAAAKRMSMTGTVSYDPNARPAIMESPEKVLGRIEELITLSDVVKASEEDLEWLYPGTQTEEVMRRWIRLGAALAITTRGPWGAYAMLSSDRDMLVIDPMNIEMVDTVGAGDSFMGGLLSGLLDAGLLGDAAAKRRLREATWTQVQPALHRATVTSALTVSKAGAYAPSMKDVEQVLEANPKLRR